MTQFKKIGLALLAVGVLVLVSRPALAQHEARPHLVHSAPEIDPVAGGAVVAVLVAGTMLIGARRARRRDRD